LHTWYVKSKKLYLGYEDKESYPVYKEARRLAKTYDSLAGLEERIGDLIKHNSSILHEDRPKILDKDGISSLIRYMSKCDDEDALVDIVKTVESLVDGFGIIQAVGTSIVRDAYLNLLEQTKNKSHLRRAKKYLRRKKDGPFHYKELKEFVKGGYKPRSQF